MSVVSEVISEHSDQKTDSSEELAIDEASFYSAKENLTICEDNKAEFSIAEESLNTVVEISQKRSDGPGQRAGEGEAQPVTNVTSLSLDLGQPGPAQGKGQYSYKKKTFFPHFYIINHPSFYTFCKAFPWMSLKYYAWKGNRHISSL